MKAPDRFNTLIRRAGLATLVATFAAATLASGMGSFVVVVGIIETPDPIEYHSLAGAVPWNEADVDGDGVVDLGDAAGIGLDVAAGDGGRLVAVWSAGPVGDRDISYSEWTAGRWTSPVVLAASTADEVAPAVRVAPSGDVHVVWQEGDEPGAVLGATRRAASGAWDRTRLLASQGRRPAVAPYGSTRAIAYERRGLAGGWEIVAAVEGPTGAFVPVVVAVSTAREARRIDLGAADGRLWVQWQHTADTWAVAEYRDGRWVAPKTRPWDGLPWGSDVTVGSSN